MKPIKTCSCGEKFFKIPKYAKDHIDACVELTGFYWECPKCKSTMFFNTPWLGKKNDDVRYICFDGAMVASGILLEDKVL